MGKVLIIDDEKQILGLLSRIIGLEGYEVLQAATCKAGLRQMEQHSPEVVLCDVFLPDGNGVDLVSDLKKLRPLSEIILLTAHGNIPDGVQAIKNGAFDYITKGDDNNKIIPLVAKAMEKASAAYQQQKKEATSVGRQYSFDTIEHMKGEAVDIYTVDRNRLLEDLVASCLNFDQAILYRTKGFIHLSLKKHGVNRKQILFKEEGV